MTVVRIGSSIPLLPTSVADRGQRARSETPSVAAGETVAAAPEREVTRIRSRVSSAREAQDFSQSNLPPRSRSALQSYLQNGPSLTERLGVELVGIDVSV